MLILLLLIPFNIFAIDVKLNNKSAIVVNKNFEVLFEKEKDEQLWISSLTN